MTLVIEFDDGKEPDAFRTIGEVCAALSLRPHVLRYWEEQFDMLRPVKRAGGRRLYRPEDVALIATIDRLVHREGYTLRGARQYLKGQHQESQEPLGERPQPIAELAETHVEPALAHGFDASLLADLKALRNTLAAALTV